MENANAGISYSQEVCHLDTVRSNDNIRILRFIFQAHYICTLPVILCMTVEPKKQNFIFKTHNVF